MPHVKTIDWGRATVPVLVGSAHTAMFRCKCESYSCRQTQLYFRSLNPDLSHLSLLWCLHTDLFLFFLFKLMNQGSPDPNLHNEFKDALNPIELQKLSKLALTLWDRDNLHFFHIWLHCCMGKAKRDTGYPTDWLNHRDKDSLHSSWDFYRFTQYWAFSTRLS